MDLKFPFEPLRTVQAAAQVVKAAAGRIDCQKLMNILYLADRASLIETGSPITGDHMFLSAADRVYGLRGVYWCMWEGWPIRRWVDVFTDDDDFVVLASDPGDSELSDYDIGLLQKLHETYPGSDPSFLPEWKLIIEGESILHLKPEDVLRAEGLSEEEVKAYQERYAPIAAMDKIRIIR